MPLPVCAKLPALVPKLGCTAESSGENSKDPNAQTSLQTNHIRTSGGGRQGQFRRDPYVIPKCSEDWGPFPVQESVGSSSPPRE